jgi:hypothetical protein
LSDPTPGAIALTGDRLPIHDSHEERAARRDEVTILGGQAGSRIEPGVEAPVQLVEVLPDAPSGGRTCRVDSLHLKAGQLQQSMHLRHRGDQARALRRRQ